MKVKIKKINPNAVVPFKTYDRDFCYDCVATSCEEVAPNVYKYGIGLAFEMIPSDHEKGWEWRKESRFALDFRPRSSVWKTGMILSNCVGTVDELFRGEVSAVFYHVMPNMPKYKIGDKIIQCMFSMNETLEFEVVDELSQTERGTGSYGSTGK
jgi:dUTP pyrophosphatase